MTKNVHVMMSFALATGAVALGCGGAEGPPERVISADLQRGLRSHLNAACGLLGTDELIVRGVRIEHRDGGGVVASVDVTNSHVIFGNPPSDCTVRVVVRYQKVGGEWVMDELRELR